MEFQITKKAKNLAFGLMGLGALLTIIGAALTASDHHFLTRFMASALISGFFFFALGLGALFFLSLKYATETGWYAAIKRVIEAVAGFLPVGMIILGTVLLIITLADGAHLYSWMDPEVQAHDEMVRHKAAYLNKPFFWIRTIAYFTTYFLFWRGFRNRSLEEDKVGGTELHVKNYKKGATFLVFFAVF